MLFRSYTAVNSWLYEDGQPKVETPVWQYVYFATVGVLAVLLVGCEILTVRRFMERRKVRVAAR